jgi:phage-related protein
MKPVFWIGDALDRLRGYSRDVRAEVGHELELVQRGEAISFEPNAEANPTANPIVAASRPV